MAIDILKAEQVKCLKYKTKEEIEKNKNNYASNETSIEKQKIYLIQNSLNDGGGLRLVAKTLSKIIWEFKYTFNGKRKETSFGTYPKVTLSNARKRAKEFKKIIEEGNDPIELNKLSLEKTKLEKEKIKHIIVNIVDEYLDKKQHNKNLKDITISKAKSRLENHFYKYLPYKEKTNIHKITYSKIIEILEILEKDNKLETLTRVKMLIIEVYKYAYTESIIKSTDVFAKLELKSFKIQHKANVRNNPTLTSKKDIKRLYNAMMNYEYSVLTKYALLFSIHTAQRQGSIITAKWKDIDFGNKVWNIPAEQMKMKKSHTVPLSSQVIEFLKELYEITGLKLYLFPNSQHLNKHMSNNTVNTALRKMGFSNEEQTAHGLRAMFKTVCKDNQSKHNLKNEFVEMVLAHQTMGSVEEAYNRAENLSEKRIITNWWSSYLNNLIEA